MGGGKAGRRDVRTRNTWRLLYTVGGRWPGVAVRFTIAWKAPRHRDSDWQILPP